MAGWTEAPCRSIRALLQLVHSLLPCRYRNHVIDWIHEPLYEGSISGRHSENSNPEWAVTALECEPITDTCPTDPHCVTGAVNDGGQRELNRFVQSTFEIAADHIRQFAENVTDDVVHLGRGIDGKKSARKTTSQLMVALQ
jgi:hypothetical protein